MMKKESGETMIDKKIYHIIKQNRNLDDRPASDRRFLTVYSKFAGWLIKHQLTTKLDYVNDLEQFANDAKQSDNNNIAKISRDILDKIEPALADDGIFHIEDLTDHQADAKPITWGYLWDLAQKDNK